MSKDSGDQEISINKQDNNEIECTGESSLLNSIVEAVMRGDMNQVVTLALSHRSSDQRVKTMVDQALSSAISNKAKLIDKSEEIFAENIDITSSIINKSIEDSTGVESTVPKSPNSIKFYNENSLNSENTIFSQRNPEKLNENIEAPCTYYISNDNIISSNSSIEPNGNGDICCQATFAKNGELENKTNDLLCNTLSQYQIANSSLQNVDSINTLTMSQQSVQVQLPGIGNFLLQIPSNFKAGDPITLPLNLPLTPLPQTSGVNPISIHTGQLMSNQLLSLYSPSANLNISAGKKMRAIAPKPSKPTYRQPLIAPKTSSPNALVNNSDGISTSALPAPAGPGRRKGNKGKKSGRKRGAPAKSHKNSSYASSTHSIDSQDASQYNESSNTMKQNCNSSMSTRSTYQCNYYVNNDSSDYLNQSHIAISHSYNELNSNTLLDNSDSGEKDLLSLAWEISNAELGNSDDFTTAYNLYDPNNLGTDNFVSSEILDQFLQNIQKDDITELNRCSATQINIDPRVSYASSFTTLPPCSTVLPSVATTTNYLNNYPSNSSNIELPQCIEIAEVVNLNTEDMLTELEKEENALLDKFVAQYGTSSQNELLRCDSQSVISVSLPSSVDCTIMNKIDNCVKTIDSNCENNVTSEVSEKEIDLNIKESNELSEIAKQIEISCSSSQQDSEKTLKSKIYGLSDSNDDHNKVDCFSKGVESVSEANFVSNGNNTISFCAIPNTSLELMYSSTADSLTPDEKAQCLMSINFDSKRNNESFYIADATLKSKTLDDFGLFEFCTDGEISLNVKAVNQESPEDIIDDDNKYIEPPILEDISDATPIQSETETEDEDINESAFKFSRLAYFTNEFREKRYVRHHETISLYFKDLIKNDSLNASQTEELNQNKFDEWYIGENKIKMPDIFELNINSVVSEKREINEDCYEENKCTISPETPVLQESVKLSQHPNNIDSDNGEIVEDIPSKINNETSNSEEIVSKNTISNENDIVDIMDDSIEPDKSVIIQEKLTEVVPNDEKIKKASLLSSQSLDSVHFEKVENPVKINEDCKKLVTEHRKHKAGEKLNILKETKNKSENKFSNFPDRNSRSRKPPKRLSIYQSINFAEKELPVRNKIKNKQKPQILELQKSTADFKRCTRSKGTISKSFDAFYEVIARHKISSKSKIFQKNLSKNEILLPNPNENLSAENINTIVIDSSNIGTTNSDHLISDPEADCVKSVPIDKIISNVLQNTTTKRLSNINKSISKSFKSPLKSDFKNSNIIRKYNLRQNNIPNKLENDQLKIKTNSKMKNSNMKEKKNVKTRNKTCLEQIKQLNLIENHLNRAVLLDYVYLYDSIDCHLSYIENKGTVEESKKDDLCFPVVNLNTILTAKCVENKRHSYDSSCFDKNVKKLCPVRKINRKLRIFSGLEVNVKDNTSIKYASLIDLSLEEIPSRFQCCTQYTKIILLNDFVINESKCDKFVPEICSAQIEIQSFPSCDEPISDTDDIESLDAPLVIVEIEEISDPNRQIKDSETDDKCVNSEINAEPVNQDLNVQPKSHSNSKLVKSPEVSNIPKSYSLRNKIRQTNNINNYCTDKKVIKEIESQPLISKNNKKLDSFNEEYAEKDYQNDLISFMNLKTPICSIEKLSQSEIIANLKSNSIDTNELPNNIDLSEKTDNLSVKNKAGHNKRIQSKRSHLKPIKRKNSIYKLLKKSLWRKIISKMFHKKMKSKSNLSKTKIDPSVKLLEDGIAHIIIHSEDQNKEVVDDESINVENDSPNNQFNTYLDSNNVETFSRNYGSFSLKIKVQKKDPNLIEDADVNKKHKRNSKKRKKLRHFLSSIIGSDEVESNKLHFSEDYTICNKGNEVNNESKRKCRKRKYSLNRDDIFPDAYDRDRESKNFSELERSHLSTESETNDESQYQKPIKIKLFKSISEELTKSEGSSFQSEKIVFSLQKSENTNDYNKAPNQKILQIIQNFPSKPCRQAANLAKKKIFSTAKEDRRSQNATLTSIWNSRKSNNGANKNSTDILTIYQNDKGKRPRGRPPKLGQSLFISEKQSSSTGTLKLKIKLSKDFKNCNNDSNSSNGEISGRTSTNDSSILNSAVAGINGPSDALSLESNNFINGITEQLDQNIEYLEAKEAKVYFDPNQVDIEKIKNSYFSSKKANSESFNIELQQRLYESPLMNINKSDNSNNRNFSQYGNIDSVDVNNLYSNINPKENLGNNKITHLPKENMMISENCYSNIMTNREPQNLSQTSQPFQFENQLSPEKNPSDGWQNSKANSVDSCRNTNNSWFSEQRGIRDPSFPNSNSIIYNPYMNSSIKESKNCVSQNQNTPFVCENENSDLKLVQRSPSKRSTSSEGRKSGSNSFSLNDSHTQLSPHYIRSGIGSVPPQLNIHPWSDETNHNTSLNHTAAAWMTYAQQQAAAAAYMDPQMKAYYNLALSQSMLNNPYCGSYGNPAANPENFYSSLHSQYLNNSKDSSEKINMSNGVVRNHNDPMNSFMEAAQMSSWEHFYSAAAMAGYHNSSQGSMDEYAGRAGNMLQAHNMLANGYPGSMLGRDHFSLESNKPPLAHQNQSGSTSPIKLTATGSTPVSSSQAYSHVQMPYSHFSGTTVGFF